MCHINKHISKNNLTILFLCIWLGLFVFVGNAQMSSQSELIQTQNQREQYSDSSAKVLQLLYNASLKSNDTTEAINSLLKLARNYSHQGNHKEVYDKLWTALLLADAANMELRKSSIYLQIGRHYNYFNRREKSLEFLNLSLNLKKHLVKNKSLEKSTLAENYLAFVSTYRELDELEMGEVYLDSCQMYLDETVKESIHSFVKFESAVILNHNKKYNEALNGFEESLLWFSKYLSGYQVLVYTYMGDTYKNLNKYSESETCYNYAIEASAIHNAHNSFTPLIYERLSDLYYALNDINKSYESLKTAKQLDAVFFDSRSQANRPLLEIQDDFFEEKEKQSRIFQEQRLKEFEQEEKVLFLERTILIGFITFLILFCILYFNYFRAKHRSEKKVLKKKQEIESQKNEEVIELKNKELAASVIKLIEKDAFIDKLKSKLSKGTGAISRQEAKQILNSISSNSANNWSEFEARFVDINKKFYIDLKDKFPELTLNDQRLCALVKLNFSSKEIAKLLNMSNESVHTTRSRLRKKLKLSRDVNLKQFIASI